MGRRVPSLDLSKADALCFTPDHDRFPCLGLAMPRFAPKERWPSS